MKLKVFINKRNGQSAVHLPKKMFIKMPKTIQIKIPNGLLKKEFRKVE